MNLPKKYTPYLTGFIMGTFMSFFMSGVVTAVNTGIAGDFFTRWVLGAWPVAWAAAVPLTVIASLFVPNLVKKLTQD